MYHILTLRLKYIYIILIAIYTEKTILHSLVLPYTGLQEKIRDLNNILYFIASVLVFVLLINIKTDNSILNRISGFIHIAAQSVLEIYLIHMQSDLKFYLWRKNLSISWLSEEINVMVFAAIIFMGMMFGVLFVKYVCNSLRIWLIKKNGETT